MRTAAFRARIPGFGKQFLYLVYGCRFRGVRPMHIVPRLITLRALVFDDISGVIFPDPQVAHRHKIIIRPFSIAFFDVLRCQKWPGSGEATQYPRALARRASPSPRATWRSSVCALVNFVSAPSVFTRPDLNHP